MANFFIVFALAPYEGWYPTLVEAATAEEAIAKDRGPSSADDPRVAIPLDAITFDEHVRPAGVGPSFGLDEDEDDV
jgi:hypothetical protein